ncbi:hypothetical protein PFISCL1PPCAC_16764, partial [Pristionchus fissidentatus]
LGVAHFQPTHLSMRFLILLAVVLVSAYAATRAEKRAILGRMIAACEAFADDHITREQAEQRVLSSYADVDLTYSDKLAMATASGTIYGVIEVLDKAPGASRFSLKSECTRRHLNRVKADNDNSEKDDSEDDD